MLLYSDNTLIGSILCALQVLPVRALTDECHGEGVTMRKALSNSKGISGFVQGLVGLVVMIACATALLISRGSHSASQPRAPSSQQLSTFPTQTALRTYTSPHFGYSFQYPATYEIKIGDETTPENADLLPDVVLLSPGAEVNQYTGDLVTGVQIRVDVLLDSNARIEEQSSVSSTYPNDETGSTIFDNSLLPRTMLKPLPANTSISAYRRERGGTTYFTVVNVSTQSLPPPYAGHEATIRFHCIDPGEPGGCRAILQGILPTLQLNTEALSR